jgi:hypothetical protein
MVPMRLILIQLIQGIKFPYAVWSQLPNDKVTWDGNDGFTIIEDKNFCGLPQTCQKFYQESYIRKTKFHN